MKTTLLLFFTFLSFSIQAQYSGYLHLPDMRTSVINNILFTDVYEKDFEKLKYNKVKNVKSYDESGQMLNEFRVNENGMIEYFSSPGDKEDNRGFAYLISWDVSGKMEKLIYQRTYHEWTYTPHYKNDAAEFIRLDFGSGSTRGQDYVFHYENEKISELHYFDKWKDTIYLVCNFIYDDIGRLAKVTTGKNFTIDSIVYEDKRISILQYKEIVKSYVMENGRFFSELTNYPSPQPKAIRLDREYPKFYAETKYYHYCENGLIDYIDDVYQGNRIKITYEYEFYE